MHGGGDCVLEQITGENYIYATEDIFGHESTGVLEISHGFLASEYKIHDYIELTNEWKRRIEIRKRKAARTKNG